ncbi:hypothetical protein AB0425_14935 [Actinosynnema sp. NPDC051121]
MSGLINFFAVPVLVLHLLFALLHQDRPRLLLKPGRREKVDHRVLGEPIALLLGGPFLGAPMVLVIPEERAKLGDNPVHVALVVLAFLLAYWLVGLLSAERDRSRRLRRAGRALGLVAAVVAADLIARAVGVPVLSQVGPLVALSVVAATAYLACLRLLDFGYWPTHLVALGWSYAAFPVLVVGVTALVDGGNLPDFREHWFVTSLQLAVLAVAGTALVAGQLRRSRWLRDGPPARPAPPGVVNWPPEEGEVWLAIVTHDDERQTHKERRVLVWDATPTHVEVLTITTQPKNGDNRYLPLSLDQWDSVLTKEGWLSLEPHPLPYPDFIKFMGHCPVEGMGDRLDRLVRTPGKPRPGFTPQRLRALAANRHVGPHQQAAPTTARGASRAGGRRR